MVATVIFAGCGEGEDEVEEGVPKYKDEEAVATAARVTRLRVGVVGCATSVLGVVRGDGKDGRDGGAGDLVGPDCGEARGDSGGQQGMDEAE